MLVASEEITTKFKGIRGSCVESEMGLLEVDFGFFEVLRSGFGDNEEE